MHLSPRRALIALVVVLIVIALAILTWPPGLSATAACRRQMVRTEGYGPWQLQGAEEQAAHTLVTYSDGYNTATCVAAPYGTLWIVVGVGQTMVGCSLGLTESGDQPCPRRAYGVIP